MCALILTLFLLLDFIRYNQVLCVNIYSYFYFIQRYVISVTIVYNVILAFLTAPHFTLIVNRLVVLRKIYYY